MWCEVELGVTLVSPHRGLTCNTEHVRGLQRAVYGCRPPEGSTNASLTRSNGDWKAPWRVRERRGASSPTTDPTLKSRASPSRCAARSLYVVTCIEARGFSPIHPLPLPLTFPRHLRSPLPRLTTTRILTMTAQGWMPKSVNW